MRELRLKYIIQMVSDIAARAKDDERALTMAQKGVQEALAQTGREATLLEKVLVRVASVGARSADQQAARIAKLAMAYQDVRKHAEGASQAMEKVAKIGAAGAAGLYTADRLLKAPMDYNTKLAGMANTAYADRGVQGRIAGKQTLNAAVTSAIRSGGGSRDDAASALDNLIASGAVSIQDAIALLPMLMRGSTASGATPEQLGSIALRGMQSFGISRDQVPEVLNMAMAAGQAGGFELKDMAKWLSQAMAAGKMSGLSGMEGMRRIMASMQASVITAGTKDEAGNNVINLLAKINSQDTANDAKKVGIDLPAYLAEKRGQGVNSLDAFVQMVDGVANKDEAYVALRKKLAESSDKGEQTATLQSMADILQGKAVGKIIQDRQALMALLAEMNNRPYIQKVMQDTRTNTSALGTSFDVMSQEGSFKRQQALNEAAIAGETAYSTVSPGLNKLAEVATETAQRFPTLSATVVGATGALAVFTAALGASGLVGLLTGRAGNAGGVIGTAGTVAAGAAGWLAKGSSYGAGLARAGLGAAGALLAGGIDAYGVATDPTLSDAEKRRGYAGAGAGAAGGLGGMLAGAAAGTFIAPGVGTLLGAIGGGVLGSWAGKAGLNALWSQDPAAGTGTTPATLGAAQRVELGQGKIDLNVRVVDDRVTWEMASQGTPAFSLSGGNTNPAGYAVRP